MVQPLVKKSKKGKPYLRPPEIEAAIAAALKQDLATLSGRAAISKATNPQYLPSEVLVYLIRDALRRADERTYNTLLKLLIHRCMINMYKHVPENQGLDASFVREEVIGRLGELFGDDAGSATGVLDFYEIRFNLAFSKLRIDVVREEAAKATALPLLEIEELSEDETDESVLARLSQAFHSPSDPHEQAEIAALCRAIDALAPEERDAVVLRYVYGYEVESTNPAEITVAKLCKVSGRTIRSRLKAALARLRRLKEIPQ